MFDILPRKSKTFACLQLISCLKPIGPCRNEVCPLEGSVGSYPNKRPVRAHSLKTGL